MKFIKNFIQDYKLETAIGALMLAWLANGLFILAFISLIIYSWNEYQNRSPRVQFYTYKGTRVAI